MSFSSHNNVFAEALKSIRLQVVDRSSVPLALAPEFLETLLKVMENAELMLRTNGLELDNAEKMVGDLLEDVRIAQESKCPTWPHP